MFATLAVRCIATPSIRYLCSLSTPSQLLTSPFHLRVARCNFQKWEDSLAQSVGGNSRLGQRPHGQLSLVYPNSVSHDPQREVAMLRQTLISLELHCGASCATLEFQMANRNRHAMELQQQGFEHAASQYRQLSQTHLESVVVNER